MVCCSHTTGPLLMVTCSAVVVVEEEALAVWHYHGWRENGARERAPRFRAAPLVPREQVAVGEQPTFCLGCSGARHTCVANFGGSAVKTLTATT